MKFKNLLLVVFYGFSSIIIAQNAKQNHCEIYSIDNHFLLLKDILKIKLIP